MNPKPRYNRSTRAFPRSASFRKDLPERGREAAAIRQSLAETVARLNPQWDLVFLEKFTLSTAQEEAANRLAEESRSLASEQKALAQRQKEKTRELALRHRAARITG